MQKESVQLKDIVMLFWSKRTILLFIIFTIPVFSVLAQKPGSTYSVEETLRITHDSILKMENSKRLLALDSLHSIRTDSIVNFGDTDSTLFADTAQIETSDKTKDTTDLKPDIITEQFHPVFVDVYHPEPVVSMTIDEAVKSLLEHNSEINKAYLEWSSGQDKLIASFGIFEPALVGNVKNETTNRPFALIEQLQNTFSSGIEGLLPTATKYNMNFSFSDIQNRFSDNTNKPYTILNFSLTQPVLRGLWFGKPILDFKVARVEKEIALHKYRATLFSKIFELEIAYWKLCYAQEKLKHSANSIKMAQEIVSDSKIQVKTGKISPLESTEASAELASRQNIFNDAQKDLISAINDLKILIAGRNYLKDTLIHASSNVYLKEDECKNDTLIDNSFNYYYVQPDYLQKKTELKKAKLAHDYQANQCLPDLNIKGSCGYLVSGRQSELVWANFTNIEYRRRSGVYSAEVEFKIPLGMNIRERKLLSVEKKNIQAAELNLQSIEIQIDNYLFASKKRLSDLYMNLQNAEIVINFRTDLLKAEITKQKAGKSNYHKIFDIEEELTKSQQWEIENIIDYRSLKAQLARLSGKMLIDKGLEKIENGKPVLAERLTISHH